MPNFLRLKPPTLGLIILACLFSLLLSWQCQSEKNGNASFCLESITFRDSIPICDNEFKVPATLSYLNPYLLFLDSLIHENSYYPVPMDTLRWIDSALLYWPQEETMLFSKMHLHYLRANWELENGKFEMALTDLREVEDYLTKNKSQGICQKVYHSTLYNRLGLAYWNLQDLDNAMASFKQNEAMSRETGIRHEIASAWANIGLVHWEAGEPSGSIRWMEQGACLFEGLEKLSLEDSISLATTYNNLTQAYNGKADSLEAMGQYISADRLRDQSLELGRTISSFLGIKGTTDPSFTSITLSVAANSAFVFTKKADLHATDSIRYYLSRVAPLLSPLSPDRQKKIQGIFDRHLAYAAALKGESQAAVQLINSALASREGPLGPNGLPLIADKRNYSNFLFAKAEVLKICGQKYPDEQKWLKASLESYLHAFDFFDQLRRQLSTDASLEALLKTRLPQYSQAFEVAYELFNQTSDSKYLNLAFQITERSKGFSLRQGLHRQISQWEDQADFGPLLMQEATLRKNILDLEQQLLNQPDEQSLSIQMLNAKSALAKFVSQLKNSTKLTDRRFFVNRLDDALPSLTEAQSQLVGSNMAIVEYLRSKTGWWVMIATQDTAQIVPIVATSEIFSTIDSYASSLEGEKEYYSKFARQLFVRLFEPVYSILPSEVHTLLIIPDRSLYTVSFEALLPSIERDTTIYLINQFAIAYHYSASSMLKARQLAALRSAPRKPFAAFNANLPDAANGIASCGGTPLPSLSAMGDSIYQQYFARIPNPDFNSATKSEFINEVNGYNIVQLALHACPSLNRKEQIFLEFYPESPKGNNHLTLPEIYRLSLGNQLVVLGNCKTAVGYRQPGEGAISLSRAFTYAGCPNVLATRTDVLDKPTADLLMLFYHFLLEVGDTPPMALAKAKREYAENENVHPWKWNNLVFFGDPNFIIDYSLKVENDFEKGK